MKVEPLVKRWMDIRFKTDHGRYRFGDSCWYGLVSAMLCQSARVGKPTVVPVKYEGFVPVSICITEFDFYHYGWEVSISQELRFSRLVRNFVTDECLRSAAMLRARYNIPLSQAINTYIVKNGFTDDDLNTETLRKTYQRRYRVVEDEYRNMDRMAVTDFGVTDITPAARSLRLHLRVPDPNQLELPL
jgi:hypothetical protein